MKKISFNVVFSFLFTVILIIAVLWGSLKIAVRHFLLEPRTVVSWVSPDHRRRVIVASDPEGFNSYYFQPVSIFPKEKARIIPQWFPLGNSCDYSVIKCRIIWSKDANVFTIWNEDEFLPKVSYDFSKPDRQIPFYEPYARLLNLDSKELTLMLVANLAKDKPEYLPGFIHLAVADDDVTALALVYSLGISVDMILGTDPPMTPLAQAVNRDFRNIHKSRLNAMKFLLSHGADVNVEERMWEGRKVKVTISLALENGKLDEVNLLLEHGAKMNINEVYDDFSTALINAVYRRQPEMIRFLVEHGADQSFKDRNGRTALDIAQQKDIQGNSYPETVEILKILKGK